MITNEDIEKAISDLGPTSDLIAESLAKEGITGVVTGPGCPLEVYLDKKFPSEGNFTVGLLNVLYFEKTGTILEAQVKLPLPAKQFVTKFDKGEYPELMKA
jgi:hypothetical protein